MIFTGFHPNATYKDMRIALSYLLFPWKWPRLRTGKHTSHAEKIIADYFDVPYAKTFDSGRTALQKALEALEVSSGDEVLVQSYTCMVVSNAIVWSGGTPVYVDITDNYTIDTNDLEKKISSRSKILIIQHTFGTPSDINTLLAIAKKHKLKVIEDCAHSLGTRYEGALTGTFGDIGMFSFGSDKVRSCVRGGALITSNDLLARQIDTLHSALSLPPRIKTIQYLATIPIFLLGKALYDVYIGKIILGLSKKLKLLGQIIYRSEMQGQATPWYPAKLANALAEILRDQLHHLDNTIKHRQKIATYYREQLADSTIIDLPPQHSDSIWLRFPLRIEDPQSLITYAKTHGVLLGDWYNDVVAPKGCNMDSAKYIKKSCPRAEQYAHTAINLPTYITQKDATSVVNVIIDYVAQHRNT